MKRAWGRALNWVRLKVCEALGLAQAMRQLNEQQEMLAKRLVAQAELDAKLVKQLNENTRHINHMLRKHAVWETENATLQRASQRLKEGEANGIILLKSQPNGG